MSETDNFIAEVTDELRRDRLMNALRRYGWIAGLVIVCVVGGAIWYEVSKSQQETAMKAAGDAMLAALDLPEAERVKALESVDATGAARVVAGLLAASEAQTAGKPEEAAKLLTTLSQDTNIPQLYRDMAFFKSVVLGAGVTDPNQRREGLEALHQGGGAFALLAYEQIALIELETGNVDAARTILQNVVNDALVSSTQRSRVEALLEAIASTTAPAVAE